MTDMMLFTDPRVRAFNERRQALIDSFDAVLPLIKEHGLVGAVEGMATIVAHPEDFQVNPHPAAQFEFLIFQEQLDTTVMGPTDLILYRLSTSHDVAFGFYNLRYIDPKKAGPVCVTMRSIRFATLILPDNGYEQEDQDALFSGPEGFVKTLEGLVSR